MEIDQQTGLPAETEEANDPSRLLLGLDIGGTKTAVLLVDRTFQVLGQVTRPTITSSPEALVAAVLATIQEALDQAGASMAQLQATGVAIPGLIDPTTGVVRLATNLNLEDYPLGPRLAGQLNTPCILENDVRAAALGAYRLLSNNEPLQDLAYLSIGTGISAGIVCGGRLHKGTNHMAGEIGHIIYERGGPICSCGMPGCLEAVASGWALARQAEERLAAAGRAKFYRDIPQGDSKITCKSVFEAAELGDPIAIEIVQTFSRRLSWAIQLLVMTYDVERVVLGGGVIRAGAALLNPLLAELALLRAQSPLAEAMLPDNKISLLPSGYNAGNWGAIMMTMEIEGNETE